MSKKDPMPLELVLVRHGRSEGNTANRASRDGDNSHFTEEFRDRPSSMFRLTETGRKQAQSAGEFIRSVFCQEYGFDRYLTSEYVRAMETAAHLDIPEAIWFRDFNLRERDWGAEMDNLPDDERWARFGEVMKKRSIDPFFWCPPGGESLANLCLRLRAILDALHRECSDQRVLIVCHGEVMWAFRIILERMPRETFLKLHLSRSDQISNCHVLHYVRRDPFGDRRLHDHYNWMRSLPTEGLTLKQQYSNLDRWHQVKRPTFTNKELLTIASSVPQLVHD